MTNHQHEKVKAYIKSNCASYDRGGLCHIETDSSGNRLCPLIYELGKTCNYAETSVIPGDPVIEALYNAGKEGASSKVDTCERCKTPIIRTSNRQKYCKPCADSVRKNKRVQYDAEQYRKASSNPYNSND